MGPDGRRIELAIGAQHEQPKFGIYLNQQGFTANPQFLAAGRADSSEVRVGS